MRAERGADPFAGSLFAGGFTRPNALSLGFDIATEGRPVGRDGAPVARL
jgi:hypothetical protein